MSGVDPVVADRIRKVLAGGLAVATAFLLLRVLARAADRTLAWGDPSLWACLALVALSVLWVRAARPVRRAPSTPPAGGEGSPSAPDAEPLPRR